MRRLRLLVRGALRRCPRCGAGGVFASFFDLRERCPGCGLAFEREEGYWVGAMIVNLVVTEGLFGVSFVLAVALTWPQVPWTALLVAAVLLNGVVPVVFYPWSKTVWLALELCFHPPSVSEEAEAAAARHAPDG